MPPKILKNDEHKCGCMNEWMCMNGSLGWLAIQSQGLSSFACRLTGAQRELLLIKILWLEKRCATRKKIIIIIAGEKRYCKRITHILGLIVSSFFYG